MSERAAPIAENFTHALRSRAVGPSRKSVPFAAWSIPALFAMAAAAQALFAPSSDVSWLITFCEKVLAGETPYVDVIESNPPAAFLVYMPATFAASVTGLPAEFLVAVSIFIAIAASLALSAWIFIRAGITSRLGAPGLAMAVAVLALLPGREFAEREHIALIAGLPLLAALTARASGAKIEAPLALLAGLGGALMASIKPHFALIVLAVLPYLVGRIGLTGLLRASELYAATVAAALGLALTAVFFPAYVDSIVPLAALVYVPVRTPLLGLALNQGFLCWAVLGVTLLLFARGRIGDCLIAAPALGSVGAAAAFLIQGKGWPYHLYPAIALMALALGACIAEPTSDFRRRTAAAAIGASSFIFAFVYFSHPPREDEAPLERLVAAVAPHPKVLTIGPDIALGFPLTRNVSGTWVGGPMGLWITASIDYLTRKSAPDEATRRRYEAYLRFDRETLIANILTKQPDAILVENAKWRDWAFADPDVAAALADYAPVGAVGEVTVYGRKLGLKPTR